MKTLIIYDSTGYVIMQEESPIREPQGGIQFIYANVPNGQRVVKIDTSKTPHEAIFETIPPTENDRITSLESAISALMGV